MSSSGIIHDVEKGAASVKDDVMETSSFSSPISDPSELVNSIMNADVGQSNKSEKDRETPRIQRVPYRVWKMTQNRKYSQPQVVSLGPYHHGKPHLRKMRECKIKVAKQFVDPRSTEDVQRFHKAVAKVITKARGSYDVNEKTADLSDEDFKDMMFLDGCFILHFILATNKGEITTSLDVSSSLIPRIAQDMFMLENQVPFVVLHALMSEKFKKDAKEGMDEICKFIDKQMFLSYSRFWRIRGYSELFGSGEDAALHLLDILRTMLLGIPSSEKVRATKNTSQHFGSVIELKQEGIRFGKSHSSNLITGVKFDEKSCCLPQLLLPPMVINDTSISQMLNLIAFEMCPDYHSHRSVSAYISFLDSLINHADDVKELRSKGILDHRLGSDERVANLFNEWPIEGLSDNLEAYEKVKQRIENYSRSSGIFDVEKGAVSGKDDIIEPSSVSSPISKICRDIAEVDVGQGKESRKDRKKTCIQKVPYTVGKKTTKYLRPQVVSLGPYHHGNGKSKQLKQMEECKIKAARQFVNSGSTEDVQRFYKAVANVITQAKGSYVATGHETATPSNAVDGVIKKARDSYSEETTAALSDEDFTDMMFLDGCFILHLIQATNDDKNTAISLVVSKRLIPRIVRDMFMLENQVPFVVLHALMTEKFEKGGEEGIVQICKFIYKQIFLSYPRFRRIHVHEYYKALFSNRDDPPLHLLDMLRTMLVGIRSPEPIPTTNQTLHHFGSVTELRTVGIRFGKSHSSKLITHVKFDEKCYISPQLLLPPMVINETFISQMLNLIAFEMCPDYHSDSSVTAYISFLDSLINHADDVKELRSKGILDHRLGSDELVANLFNEWPIEGLSDNLQEYEKVKQGIENYRRNRVRIRIGEWLYTYFRRPWTIISLVAAILLLFFTGVQTYRCLH